MQELERHLHDACAADERLKVLDAQWSYDKRLLAQALQAIVSLFPHYSRHDTSHSDAILLNITRILGPRVQQLSATDTWLLLEAAYWHDAGMIVREDTLREWLTEDDFQQNLLLLQRSSDPAIASAAKLLADPLQLDLNTNSWALDIRRSVILIGAEYARARHAERAGDAVRKPHTLNIESPRTFIPSRLFEHLARICVGHGQRQSEVIDLPYRENGLGLDFCHPRFIAFLLRLGDLLDLDNGRFCPVMLATFGQPTPTTLAHIGKHAAIRRFHVSAESVDVTAECSDGEDDSTRGEAHASYEAITEWLEWLEKELTYIAIKWSSIAPEGMGRSPSIGTIEATLLGYELPIVGKAARFDIDREYFLGLTKSSSLFGNPQEAWQRELIMNAADATLIRVWSDLTLQQRRELAESENIVSAVQVATKHRPVSVEIAPIPQDAADIAAQKRQWRVRIRDQGCGMTRQDIQALQIIGSAAGLRARRPVIAEMPDAMRPAGSFGLGFQSVFLDTDMVVLRTCDIRSMEVRTVEIRRPEMSSPSNTTPGIFVQRHRTDAGLPPEIGTTIEFIVRRPATFGKPHYSDPIAQDDEGSVDANVWRTTIEKFCAGIPVPVALNGELLPTREQTSYFNWFDTSESLLISFRPPSRNQSPQHQLRSYRGVALPPMGTNVSFFEIAVDLFSGRASDYLQVNRTELTTLGHQEFQRRTESALPRALTAFTSHLRAKEAPSESDHSLLARASLVAQNAKLTVAGSEWQSLPILIPYRDKHEHPALPLGKLSELQDFLLLQGSFTNFGNRFTMAEPADLSAFTLSMTGAYEARQIIESEFPQRAVKWIFGPTNDFGRTWVQVAWFGRTGTLRPEYWPIAIEAFHCILVTPVFSGRRRLPCPSKYKALAVRSVDTRRPDDLPHLLSPFIDTVEVFDGTFSVRVERLYHYLDFVLTSRTQETGEQPEVERADISDAARELLADADALFSRFPQFITRNYGLPECLRTIDRWREKAR